MSALVSESDFGEKAVALQLELDEVVRASTEKAVEVAAANAELLAALQRALDTQTRQCFYEVRENEPSDVLTEWEFASLIWSNVVTRGSPRVHFEGMEDWATLGEVIETVDLSLMSDGIVYILTNILPEAESRLQERASLQEEAATARAAAACSSELLERFKRVGAAAAGSRAAFEEGMPPSPVHTRHRFVGTHGLSSGAQQTAGGRWSHASAAGLGIDETAAGSLGLHGVGSNPEPNPQTKPGPEPEINSRKATNDTPPSQNRPSTYTSADHSHAGSECSPYVVRIASQYARQSSAAVTKWGDHESGLVVSDRQVRDASTSSSRLIEQMRRDRERRASEAERARRRGGR